MREQQNGSPEKVILNEDLAVKVGRLPYALPLTFLEKLIINFKERECINEVYIYGQLLNNEVSTVLGVKLDEISDQNIAHAYDAFKRSLEGEKLEQPNSMIIIPNDDWLQTIRNIKGALFYQK